MGPLGPKLENESENEFPGPLGPRAQKRVHIVEKQSILTLFRLRSRLFGPRAKRPRELILGSFFPTLGSEGPNDPCSRARESQLFGVSDSQYEGQHEGSWGISTLQ